jgi:hypothetical protein
MSDTATNALEKTVRLECDHCETGTVSIDMRPDQYPILKADAQASADDEDERASIEATYGEWPGFELRTGTCDSCGTRWARGTATAVRRAGVETDDEFYKPLRCPSCHHRFTVEPECYPTEDDVEEKRLDKYTAAEVQQAGEQYYSLYMTKGVECRWNDACDVTNFYFKGRL